MGKNKEAPIKKGKSKAALAYYATTDEGNGRFSYGIYGNK